MVAGALFWHREAKYRGEGKLQQRMEFHLCLTLGSSRKELGQDEKGEGGKVTIKIGSEAD